MKVSQRLHPLSLEKQSEVLGFRAHGFIFDVLNARNADLEKKLKKFSEFY
jgi:hypothetical protein